MSAGDVVTASLAALERGEIVCVPGLDDPSAIDALAGSEAALLTNGNRPTLATRYQR